MISLLYPSFLWASLLVLVPIIIHLFNFRKYKTVYFSNVSFLNNIKQQTQSKSKLRHLLILASRILFILALVIAFAQPVIIEKNQKVNNLKNIVAIYIDNSFSTNLESKNGKVIDVEKKYANSIIDAYNANTSFYLFTNSFSAKNSKSLNKNEITKELEKIIVEPNVKKLSSVVSLIKDNVNKNNTQKCNKSIYLISDMQQSTADITNIKNDSLIDLKFIPVIPQTINNLFIDTCWFDSPIHKINQTEVLNVTIKNSSNEKYNNIPIKFYINDSLKSFDNFDIDLNQSKTIRINYNNYKTGLYNCRVEITDFPIIYDNSLYLSYKIKEKVNLLEVFENNPNKYIDALFKNDNYINHTSQKYENLQQGNLTNYDAIILNQILKPTSGLIQIIKNLAQNSKPILIIPNNNIDIDLYNELLKSVNQDIIFDTSNVTTKIKNIDYSNSIFKNVFTKKEKNADLPTIYKYLILNKTNNNITIFKSNNDLPLFVESNYYNSKIYMLAFSLDETSSNFVHHQLFVPVIYNFALNTKSLNNEYYTLNQSNYFLISDSLSNQDVYHITNNIDSIDFIPIMLKSDNSTVLNFNNLIRKAGNYYVKKDNKIIDILSVNYNRLESNLSFFDIKKLGKIIAENILNAKLYNVNNTNILKNNIIKNNMGEPIWKYFLYLSLFFILIEIILLRAKIK